MKVDLHTHTIASGHAWGTLFENAQEAKKQGIELLGLTEHGPAVLGSVTKNYFNATKRVPQNINGVRILFGVETNIIDEQGNLDLENKILEKLDIVILGFHYNCGYVDQGIEKNTRVLIRAMHNPYVKMLAHPYRSVMKIDIKNITKEAIKKNILLEINASCFSEHKIKVEKIEGIKTMIKILKNNNQKMVISSDAHNPYEVGNFSNVVAKFDELDLSEDDLLNNDPGAILKFFNIS